MSKHAIVATFGMLAFVGSYVATWAHEPIVAALAFVIAVLLTRLAYPKVTR